MSPSSLRSDFHRVSTAAVITRLPVPMYKRLNGMTDQSHQSNGLSFGAPTTDASENLSSMREIDAESVERFTRVVKRLNPKSLSKRELEVFYRIVVLGGTRRALALDMCCTGATVEVHLTHAARKFNLTTPLLRRLLTVEYWREVGRDEVRNA